MSAIKINGLTKTFGAFTALSGLNLEVAENTVFGFLGPNGAGKTTTIRMMVGLSRPSAGEVEIAGHKIQFFGSESNALFGYLPEQPSFYNWMTGAEYLNFVAGIFGITGDTKSERIDSLLELAGLEAARDKKIGSYSRGMKQRLGIAQALMNDPKVVILDEPVSALDPIGRKEILNIIEELKKDKTVFMSTHILADVDRVCDHVAIIDMGELIVQSSLAELKEKYAIPIVEIEFYGDPQALVAALEKNPWVRKVEKNANKLRIWLTDAKAMESNVILKLLADSEIGVMSFGLNLPETEDLFVQLLGDRS